MAETLFNWAVMLGTFGVLVMVAWLSYRDLRSFSESRFQGSRLPMTADAWETEIAPTDAEPVEAEHLLRLDYTRDGNVQHTQWVTDEKPGFIGTESLPGMGSGILVRHVRVFRNGDSFVLENRHGSRPLAWRSNGQSGELPPGATLPIHESTEVLLGDWTVECREDSPWDRTGEEVTR
jgi:hypothetical protein